MTTLLTGATGLVGSRLVVELGGRLGDERLELLLRADGDWTARQRYENLLDTVARAFLVDRDRLRRRTGLIEGDLLAPRMGLSAGAWSELAMRTRAVVHCAASVRLEQQLRLARAINVGGTEAVLALARASRDRGGFNGLHHVSTAYVAGRRSGCILEDELERGQRFNNDYERSKFEAERIARAAAAELPIAVYRPSIVVGDSQTGWTTGFNVIYGPLRMGYLGRLPFYPASSSAALDIVPVDFVARALALAVRRPESFVGRTLHLTVGPGRGISPTELAKEATRHLLALIDEHELRNPRRVPRPMRARLLRALTSVAIRCTRGRRRRALQGLRPYLDYTVRPMRFENHRAASLLGAAGIRPPRLTDYLGTLCRFAVETHFGGSDRPQHVGAATRRGPLGGAAPPRAAVSTPRSPRPR